MKKKKNVKMEDGDDVIDIVVDVGDRRGGGRSLGGRSGLTRGGVNGRL